MQTRDFLQTIFPYTGPDDPRAGEMVRFAVVKHPEQRFPGVFHWRTRAALHMLDEGDASALGFDVNGRDVYFTPHSFTRQAADVTKEDSSARLDVAWV